jgi:hypothetical protein
MALCMLTASDELAQHVGTEHHTRLACLLIYLFPTNAVAQDTSLCAAHVESSQTKSPLINALPAHATRRACVRLCR